MGNAVIVCLLSLALGQHISLRNYVIKEGPGETDFGYRAVATPGNGIFVGAPRNGTNFYKCEFSKERLCEKIEIPFGSINVDYTIVGSGGHGGATMEYSNGSLLVCAPNLQLLIANNYFMTGGCFLYENLTKMSSLQFSIPCVDSPDPTSTNSKRDTCLSGFAAKFLNNGGILIASPNFYMGIGGIQNGGYSLTFGRKDKYFGFDFAMWKETADDHHHIFASSLKGSDKFGGNIYSIMIVGHQYEVYYSLANENFGSMFGHSIKFGDSNGDGFDEIFVSAPFYWAKDSAGHVLSGAIFHYAEQNRDIDAKTVPRVISFPQREDEKGNFGFSFEVIDINADGFCDLVVGDPNLRKGRVYVYLGGKGGVSASPSQIIDADQIDSSLEEFGYSLISAGDIDKNGYTDLIAGARKSNKIVMLFSMENVNVKYDLVFCPKTALDAMNNTCQIKGILGVCLNARLKILTDKHINDKVTLQYKLRITSNFEGKPLTLFYSTETTELEDTVQMTGNRYATNKLIFVSMADFKYIKLDKIAIEASFHCFNKDPEVFVYSLQPIKTQTLFPPHKKTEYFINFRDFNENGFVVGDMSDLLSNHTFMLIPTTRVINLGFSFSYLQNIPHIFFELTSSLPLTLFGIENMHCDDRDPNLKKCVFDTKLGSSVRYMYSIARLRVEGDIQLPFVGKIKAALKFESSNLDYHTWSSQKKLVLETHHSISGHSDIKTAELRNKSNIVSLVHTYVISKRGKVDYPVEVEILWPHYFNFYNLFLTDLPTIDNGNCIVDKKYINKSGFVKNFHFNPLNISRDNKNLEKRLAKHFISIKCKTQALPATVTLRSNFSLNDLESISRFFNLESLYSVGFVSPIDNTFNLGKSSAKIFTSIKRKSSESADVSFVSLYISCGVGFVVFISIVLLALKQRYLVSRIFNF